MDSVYVVDNRFNRENYPDLVGRHFFKHNAPSYVRVREGIFPYVGFLQAELDVTTVVAITRLEAAIRHIGQIDRKAGYATH